MKTLDDLLAKLEHLNIPILVKGKEYPGNNPYVMNKINAMLEAGHVKKRFGELTYSIETLEPEDITWNDERIEWRECNGCKYIHSPDLEHISTLINEDYNELSYENNQRLAKEESVK